MEELAFQRVVREVVEDMFGAQYGLRFQRSAVTALQSAAEGHLEAVFEDTTLSTVHAKRITTRKGHMDMARRIRGELL